MKIKAGVAQGPVSNPMSPMYRGNTGSNDLPQVEATFSYVQPYGNPLLITREKAGDSWSGDESYILVFAGVLM